MKGAGPQREAPSSLEGSYDPVAAPEEKTLQAVRPVPAEETADWARGARLDLGGISRNELGGSAA